MPTEPTLRLRTSAPRIFVCRADRAGRGRWPAMGVTFRWGRNLGASRTPTRGRPFFETPIFNEAAARRSEGYVAEYGLGAGGRIWVSRRWRESVELTSSRPMSSKLLVSDTLLSSKARVDEWRDEDLVVVIPRDVSGTTRTPIGNWVGNERQYGF